MLPGRYGARAYRWVHEKPLYATIRRVLALYRPGGCHGHRRRCRVKHNTIKQTEDIRNSPTNEEDDDIIILSDDDDDRILDDNLDIAPPSETTYHVTCYMTRNTTPTRTLAHYDVFTSFTIPANTNSFLDNAHYQHIKTEARRKMLTREPLKSLILDGVSIQLHVPQVYYEVKGGDKQQVPLPLSPESMAHIPEPRYHKRDDGATFVLLSVYFVMTLDYFHVVHKKRRLLLSLLCWPRVILLSGGHLSLFGFFIIFVISGIETLKESFNVNCNFYDK